MNKEQKFLLVILLFLIFKYLLAPLWLNTAALTRQYIELKTVQKEIKLLFQENQALLQEGPAKKTVSPNELRAFIGETIRKGHCQLVSERTLKDGNKKERLEKLHIDYHIKGNYSRIAQVVLEILSKQLPVRYQRICLQADPDNGLSAFFTLCILSFAGELP